MVMDVIGAAIGFSLVMLLLSLIVTSLSQATQALLRLRGRNLRIGIAAALTPAEDTKVSKSSLADAADLMNRSVDATLRRQADSSSLWARILGPAVTWMDEDTLRALMLDKARELARTSADPGNPRGLKKAVKKAVKRFSRLEKTLKNRFKNIMRGVSLFWALVVAAVFQISAPQFIQELSTDPRLRAQFVAASGGVPKKSSDRIQDIKAGYFDAVYRAVLEKMSKDRQDLSDLLKNLDLERDVREQFADITKDRNNKTDRLSTFDSLVIEGTRRNREAVITNARAHNDRFGLIDITPMRYGTSFYTETPQAVGNIIGVLLTAILLTLGAPFWYNALQTAVRWRDQFAPPRMSRNAHAPRGKRKRGTTGPATPASDP